MGLLFLALACIVAVVLPCMIVASSRSVRTGQQGGRRRRGASEEDADEPAVAAPLMERWWFKLAGRLIGPAAVFAFLALLVRNVQNGVTWNDASWALILPFGLVVSCALLLRARWEWAPVIDGTPPRPPWQIVLAKATAKFLTVVVAVVAVCGLAAISLETWPVLNTSLDSTGLKVFAAALDRDGRTQVAGLAVLFVLLYWRTNTVTRPEYVRPDGSPIPPPGAGASAWIPAQPKAAPPFRRDVSGGGGTFWKLAFTALLIGAIWFLGGDQIRTLWNQINAPAKLGSVTPAITQHISGERLTSPSIAAPAYQAPSPPTANALLTLSFEDLQPARAAGYNLFPKVTIIPPRQWVNVYWPDVVYKDGSSWKYVYFRGGNVTVEDCITKARVPLRGPTRQEANGPNLSCQPMHVFVDSQSYGFFYSLL